MMGPGPRSRPAAETSPSAQQGCQPRNTVLADPGLAPACCSMLCRSTLHPGRQQWRVVLQLAAQAVRETWTNQSTGTEISKVPRRVLQADYSRLTESNEAMCGCTASDWWRRQSISQRQSRRLAAQAGCVAAHPRRHAASRREAAACGGCQLRAAPAQPQHAARCPGADSGPWGLGRQGPSHDLIMTALRCM